MQEWGWREEEVRETLILRPLFSSRCEHAKIWGIVFWVLKLSTKIPSSLEEAQVKATVPDWMVLLQDSCIRGLDTGTSECDCVWRKDLWWYWALNSLARQALYHLSNGASLVFFNLFFSDGQPGTSILLSQPPE
jgi:hypothetical protein